MKYRILWISFLAFVLLFSVVSLAPTAHAATQKTQVTAQAACGAYPIQGSSVNGKDVSGNTVTLTLWYNSCTGYNYGVVTFYYYYRGQLCIEVRDKNGNGAGTCGPIISGTGSFAGPAMYAPVSQAQATFSAAYPNSDIYLQTGWF